MTTSTQGSRDIVGAFQEVPSAHKLELLLEYSEGLPALPDEYQAHPELLERVEECQSPVFLFVEVQSASLVRIYLSAPDEAPTTKGFASLLQLSLDGESVESVLTFDESFVEELGITELVSPLRIRGLHGMLTRIKRQVREKYQ
jgi:cysteine desulfuration protein SufE